MSLSDAPYPPDASEPSPESPQERDRWGTVFMGPDKMRESRMDKMLNQHERDLWNRGTEIEYLRRVREKATAEVTALLAKAREDIEEMRRAAGVWAEQLKVRTEEAYGVARREQADAEALRAEAERIRAGARDEGYQAGLAAARSDVEEHENRRDAAASAVLHRIQEQYGVIFAAWREELAALTREAVQTATGWAMHTEHAAVLEQVLAQSVQELESRQYFTAHVNPGDEAMTRDLLGQAQDVLGLERWAVLADPEVEPGGVRLESDAGRVENYPAIRRAIVEEAMSRLGLPREHDCAALTPLPELAALPEPPEPSALPAAQAEEASEPLLMPEIPAAAEFPELTDIPDAADLPDMSGLDMPGLDMSGLDLPEAAEIGQAGAFAPTLGDMGHEPGHESMADGFPAAAGGVPASSDFPAPIMTPEAMADGFAENNPDAPGVISAVNPDMAPDVEDAAFALVDAAGEGDVDAVVELNEPGHA